MNNSTSLQCTFETLVPIRFPLANSFYKRCGYPVSCGRLEQVYCLRTIIDGTSTIIAAARFLPQEPGCYLLRNLCVDARWRLQGIARLLMQHALGQLPIPRCYCFALRELQAFYESLGFVMLTPDIVFASDSIPFDISQRYQRYSETRDDLLLMGFNA